ncbi:MAG: FG-GAP-like repeat-containing protein [Bradymonadaceae bacterium]
MRTILLSLTILLAMTCIGGDAFAQTITSQNASTPYPGIRLVSGRTSSPATNFKAAFIDLCNDYVHVDASAPGGTRTVASWGQSVGAQLAVNGDFYAFANNTSHVYGDAVGNGQRWPSIRTGRDDAYSGSWFYMKYGWIAFGDGWVEFSNTEQVKNRHATYGTTQGWRPTEVTTAIPPGTNALLSGFPQLVIEGTRYTCSSPTASSCFPDRSDMRDRHPRTAMGLTEDRQTFILVTVDGRSTSSAGMYGSELAKLMHDLGAWVAFNLDGGASTQMWVQGQGTINNPSGTSLRAVLNHWGIYAGAASGKARTPGSCDPSRGELLHHAHIWDTGTTTDINGDGMADACGRGPEGVECFLSNGEGLSTRIEGPPLRDGSGWGDPTNYSTIRMGDVNGDGLADICARANARMYCWLSDGEGFPTRIDGPELSNAQGFEDLMYLSTIRLADFNGDGMDDICVRTATDFRCYPSTGDGFGPAVIGPALSDASGWGRPRNYGTIRMADVSGNGRADVCARANAGIRCWLSDGDGFSTRINGPEWSNAAGWDDVKYWSTIRLADIDGDGRADICGRDADGIKCHLSTGDGFGPEIVGPALSDASGWGDESNYSTIRLADVDGDGSLDLCARSNAGMRCWLWDGTKFSRRIEGGMANETGWHAERFYRTIQFADVNGNGRADLCARASARYFCWLSDGDGFPDRIEGPEWSDGSGWSDVKHYSTIRMAGPRPQPEEDEKPDPAQDAGSLPDVGGAHDVGGLDDAGGVSPDGGTAGPGGNNPGGENPGGDVEGEDGPAQDSVTSSSCACRIAGQPPSGGGLPLQLGALGALGLFGLLRRRKNAAAF